MKKRLRDIANIRVGYQFRGRITPDPSGTVRLIQTKDIDSYQKVCTEDLVPLRLDRPPSNLLQQGEVLFLARGLRQYAAVVKEPLENTIAAGYFFILRVISDKVRPEYLAWCINQPEFQEALRPLVRGTNIPLVSKADFQDLQIQLPPIAVQDKIVKLNDLLEQENRVLKDLQEKRATLIHALRQQLARHTTGS
jgi:restriction endonuclease S subunit